MPDTDGFCWDDTILGELAREAPLLTFAARAILMSEGDVSNSLYLVVAGRVKVFTSDAAGRELVLNVLGAGEILGEMAVDGGTRSASVMAVEPTRCAVIPLARLLARLREQPELALELNQVLIQRLRKVTQIATDLALSNVYNRVISLLLSLAESTESGQFVVAERLSQQDIANRVGASRDMVSRVFKELVKGGYLVVDHRVIVIKRKPPLDW
jgi:cAMP-binding proteins - catabolite gene activator and regulatory subunit of cAMP-dependent protein kinases